MTIIVDRNSVEVFAGNGYVVITDLIFPSVADRFVSVFAENGEASFTRIAVTNLPPEKTRVGP